MTFEGKNYVAPSAIASRWGCSRSTVIDYIKRGLVPGAFKHNGAWYVPPDAKMPVFDETKPGIKPGKAKQIKPNSSRNYDLWLDDIERQRWSKLFLEV